MSKKKNIKKNSTRKPALRSSNRIQSSNDYIPKRIPSGMTKIGVGNDGVEVYVATPQIMKLYYPELYALAPKQPGYIFTGKDGVYTPVGQSNHAYDEIIKNNPVKKNPVAVKTSSARKSNKPSDNTEVSTYSNTPASNPYNVNDPFLLERFRQLFWNNGGRDIWLKLADARARALTPTLGTFAKLAWKPIETVMPSNLLGTLFKLVRNPSLSRLSSDLLGSGFGGGNLGLTEISDDTANWAQNNPEANGVINMFGDVGAGLLTAPTRALINQGFRAITPSTYVTSGLANAGRTIGGITGNFIVSNAGRAGTAADLAAFGVPAYNAWEEFAENPTVANGVIATGATIPAAGPAFKTLRAAAPVVKAVVPRVYNTTNGKVVGFNMGDYAVGLDARGVNAYSGLPFRGGRIIKKPNTLTSLDFGPEFEVETPQNTLTEEDIKVGDLIRRSNNEIAYVSKVGEHGVTVTTKLGDKFNISKDTVKNLRVDNPEVSRGTVLQIRTKKGDIEEVTATGKLDKFGNIEVLDAQRNRHSLSYDDKVNPGKTTITSSQNDIILDPDELAVAFLKNLREAFGKTIGTENLSKVGKTISSGVSNFGKSVRSQLNKLLEARAARNLQKLAETLANVELETLVNEEPILTIELTFEPVYNESSVLSPVVESHEFEVGNGINPTLVQAEIPKNEPSQLFNFDGKTYVKVQENINGNPVLREWGSNSRGPLRDSYVSEPQEVTIDKNTFNLHAIQVNKNGIPLDVDAGLSYKDSDGVTHTIISINSKTGAIKVLNSKTNEIVDSSALDFIKTKRQVEASEILNNESNIGVKDENIIETLNNLDSEIKNTQNDNSNNNSNNNSYSDKTQDLFSDGTFTEGGSSTTNEGGYSTEGTSKTLRVMPRYTKVKIDGVQYKIKGNEGNRILLGDPKNNKTIKVTLDDLYNSNHAIEVVEGGHTFGWGPLSGNKVNGVYTPDTKFKRVPLIFGLKVSPYRQFSFTGDILKPTSVLGIPYGLYELDKNYDAVVNDALLPWKWDVLDKFKTALEGQSNSLKDTEEKDSTYNANPEIDYDDVASYDADSADSSSVSGNNPTLTKLKDASNLDKSSYLGDDDYITSLDYSNEGVNLSTVNSDTALAVQSWLKLVRKDPKEYKKMLDTISTLNPEARKSVIYDYMKYGEGSKKR